MWDLVFILGLGDGLAGREPRLVEVGREMAGGRPKRRLFVWSTRRIGAAVEGGRVSIRRNLGAVGDGPLVLSKAQLHALDAACTDWAERRDRWAAYWASCAGYPAGYGGAWYYQAPGGDTKREQIGSSSMGGRRGKEFTGRDVTRPLGVAVLTPTGASIVGEIRREGESAGPGRIEIVGAVYALGGNARLDARRHDADLVVDGRTIGLEPGRDEAFVCELIEAVEADA